MPIPSTSFLPLLCCVLPIMRASLISIFARSSRRGLGIDDSYKMAIDAIALKQVLFEDGVTPPEKSCRIDTIDSIAN